jgi:putative salt-induced outer membrane protein YdiY
MRSRLSTHSGSFKVISVKHLYLLKYLSSFLLFFPLTSHAVVNLEQAIIGPTTDGFHTRMDLVASGASGNSEYKRTQFDLLTLWKDDRNTEFLQVQYAYGTSSNQIDTDNAFAHLRHRTEMDPTWGIEAFTQISRNPFARLTQRTLLGGGVRLILYEEDKKSAGYLGLGAFQENEIRTEVVGTTDVTHTETLRANVYLILKYQLNDQVRFINNTFYQPALNDVANVRLLEQASLLVRLDDHLDLKISAEVTYDSIPPQTVQPRDVFYSTGITLSF